ncbi:glucooligosaccharide oxidase [Panaeolus papilionaceus]|nr:glucooligosaccharide oxidase [Panaeolus papilionaceus]
MTLLLRRVQASFLILSFLCVQIARGDLISSLQSRDFQVVSPTDIAYANASAPFNLRFSWKPAAVTYPRSAQDISDILKISTEHGLSVSARSGGHSYIANALGGKDGAVVVDLSLLNTMQVDPSTNLATIGTGNTLGDLALALNANGRAMPHGTCPYVGVGGHSGHGGFGLSSRAWGLTLDTIESLEVVLANGDIVTASSESHPDLFWALRGSSSSFGIVTSVTAKTFPAPSQVTTIRYSWDLAAADASAAILAFQNYSQVADIPPELGLELVMSKGSALGRVFFRIQGGYYTPDINGTLSSTLSPLLTVLPKPTTITVIPRSYIDSVNYFGGEGTLNTTIAPETPNTFYAKSLMVPDRSPLTKAAVDKWTQYLGGEGFNASTKWFVDVELYGGRNSAINSVPNESTSFGRRDALFTMQFYTSAPGGLPPFPEDGFTLLDDMVDIIIQNSPKNWDYGAYANYVDDRLFDWQRRYYASHYPRLEALKAVYDPRDVFRFPTSIQE